MRLDGEIYKSTIQSLEVLSPKLSVGGYGIIDDYGLLRGAKRAVHDCRGVEDDLVDLVDLDDLGVYWRTPSGNLEPSLPEDRVTARDVKVGEGRWR
jgi:O-methyltransferase